jgi:glycosyltransferase involved in cell wall biosynthesis
MSGLRIAMVGQRGVPATWGGIERHVAELGSRLVRRGHTVTVFNRTNYQSHRWRHFRGMRVQSLPTVGTKHFDAIVHSLLSTLAAAVRDFDVVHFHALGPGLCAPIARAVGRSGVVQTVHGLDNQRAKWGGTARRVLDVAEWMSPRVPDETIVVSNALVAHYRRHHGRHVTFVPNGVSPGVRRPVNRIHQRFGLRPGYALFVGRLVPEKAPHLLLDAYRRVPGDRPLVIAGGSSFTNDYVAALHRSALEDPRVKLLGYVYGDDLAELYSNAGVFVLPSALEGLPLTLLEAASYGVPVVASDIAPHLEVLAPAGPGRRVFASGSVEGLTAALNAALDGGHDERAGAAALRRDVLASYDWERAATMTEAVYQRALGLGEPAVPIAS